VGEVVVGHGVEVAADDPVDVGRRQPGVGDRRQRRLRGQGEGAAAGVRREARRADPADGAAVAMAVLGGGAHDVRG